MKKLLFFCLLISSITYSQVEEKTDSLKLYFIDAVTISATKYEIELKKLPVSMNIVNNNLINSQISSNPSVGEYVRYTPGVSVGHGNRNLPSWIHLRGTGYFYGRTLYMADEIPLNDPRLSLSLHPENMTSMEVILGPSSSLYGPNAAGGAVNVRSKTGRDLSGVLLGQSFGTFGTLRPNIEIGASNNNFDYYASFKIDDSKGYKNTDLNTGLYLFDHNLPSYLNQVSIQNEKYTNSFISGNIGYRNNINSFGVSAGIHYFYEDKYAGRENAGVDGSRYVINGKAYYTIPNILKSTFRFGYHGFRNFTHNTRGAVRVKNDDINGRYVFKQVDSDYSYVYEPALVNHADILISNMPLDLQTDIYLIKNNILTVGGTYTREGNRSKTFNPDRTKILSETRYDINRYALYMQDLYQFFDNKLSLLLGVRYDAWDFMNIYDLESGDNSHKQIFKEAFNFRGGIKYFISEKLQLKTSAGTAFYPGSNIWLFQNVSTGTIWREANPNLRPEKTRMVDLGAEYVMFGFKLSATFYYGEIVDAINYRYDRQHPTLPGVQIARADNSDEVDIRGLELSGTYDLLNNLFLASNLTLNKSEITKSPINKGNQLRNSPSYFGNLGFIYTDNNLFNFRFFARFSDDRYYDDENTQLDYYHMKPYLVFDAKLWKSFYFSSNELLLSLGIDNVFNTKYDGEFTYNAPGRYVEFSIKYFLKM